MGKKASTITLSIDGRIYLEAQTSARTIQAQTVNRARIMLLKMDGISIDGIVDKVGMNRKSVMLCINKYGILQSMNSASGRCHDNARCESMWARFKEELLYGRYDTTSMTVEQLKTLIWRYFISYWNDRRICSANGGLPPMVKRQQYYASLQGAA